MNRYKIWLVLAIFALLMAVKAWLEFGLGRNVYAVDIPIDSHPTDCAGSMLINADETCINFSFYNRSDKLIDSYTIYNE